MHMKWEVCGDLGKHVFAVGVSSMCWHALYVSERLSECRNNMTFTQRCGAGWDALGEEGIVAMISACQRASHKVLAACAAET